MYGYYSFAEPYDEIYSVNGQLENSNTNLEACLDKKRKFEKCLSDQSTTKSTHFPSCNQKEVLNAREPKLERPKAKAIDRACQSIIDSLKTALALTILDKPIFIQLKNDIKFRLDTVIFKDLCNIFLEDLVPVYRKRYDLSSDIQLLNWITKECDSSPTNEVHRYMNNNVQWKVSAASAQIVRELKRMFNTLPIEPTHSQVHVFTESVERILTHFASYGFRKWTEYYRLYRMKFDVHHNLQCLRQIMKKGGLPETVFSSHLQATEHSPVFIDLTEPDTIEVNPVEDANSSDNQSALVSDVTYYLAKNMKSNYENLLDESAKQYECLVKGRLDELVRDGPKTYKEIYQQYVENNSDDSVIFEELIKKQLSQRNISQDVMKCENVPHESVMSNLDPMKIIEDRIVCSVHKKYPELYEYHLTIFRCLLRNRIDTSVKGKPLPRDEVYKEYRSLYTEIDDERLLLDVLKGEINWIIVRKYCKTTDPVDVSNAVWLNSYIRKDVKTELKQLDLKRKVCDALEEKLNTIFQPVTDISNNYNDINNVTSKQIQHSFERRLSSENIADSESITDLKDGEIECTIKPTVEITQEIDPTNVKSETKSESTSEIKEEIEDTFKSKPTIAIKQEECTVESEPAIKQDVVSPQLGSTKQAFDILHTVMKCESDVEINDDFAENQMRLESVSRANKTISMKMELIHQDITVTDQIHIKTELENDNQIDKGIATHIVGDGCNVVYAHTDNSDDNNATSEAKYSSDHNALDKVIDGLVTEHLQSLLPSIKTKLMCALMKDIELAGLLSEHSISFCTDRQIIRLCGKPILPADGILITFLTVYKPLSIQRHPLRTMAFADIPSEGAALLLQLKEVKLDGNFLTMSTLKEPFPGLMKETLITIYPIPNNSSKDCVKLDRKIIRNLKRKDRRERNANKRMHIDPNSGDIADNKNTDWDIDNVIDNIDKELEDLLTSMKESDSVNME